LLDEIKWASFVFRSLPVLYYNNKMSTILSVTPIMYSVPWTDLCCNIPCFVAAVCTVLLCNVDLSQWIKSLVEVEAFIIIIILRNHFIFTFISRWQWDLSIIYQYGVHRKRASREFSIWYLSNTSIITVVYILFWRMYKFSMKQKLSLSFTSN
jgi:hypothetical protein